MVVFFVSSSVTPSYDPMYGIESIIDDDGVSMAIDEAAYLASPNARNLAAAHRYLSNGRCDIIGATMPPLKQAIGPCETSNPNALKMKVKFGGGEFDYDSWEDSLDFDDEDPFNTCLGNTRFARPTGTVPLTAVGDQPKARTNSAIAELEVLEEDPLVGTYMAVARVADRYKALGEDPKPWYETVASWWKIPVENLLQAVSAQTGILSIPRTFVACGKRASKLYGLDNYAGRTRYTKEKLTREHFLSREEENEGYHVAIDFGWLNAAMEYMVFTSDAVRPKNLRYNGVAEIGFGVAFDARTLVKDEYYTPILPDVERYEVCDKSLFFNTMSIMNYKNDAARFLKRAGADVDELGLSDKVKAYFQKASKIHVSAIKEVRKKAAVRKIAREHNVQAMAHDLLEAQCMNLNTVSDIAQKVAAAKHQASVRAKEAMSKRAEKLERMRNTLKKPPERGEIKRVKKGARKIHKFPVSAGDAKQLVSMIGAVENWGNVHSEALGLLTADLKNYKVTEAKVAALLVISVKPFYHNATRAVSPEVIESMMNDAPKLYTSAEKIAHSLLARYSKSVKRKLAELTVQHSKMDIQERFVTDKPSEGTFLACVSKWAAWYRGKAAGTPDTKAKTLANQTKRAILKLTYNTKTNKVVLPDFDELTRESIKNFTRRSKCNIPKEVMATFATTDDLIAYADQMYTPPISFETVHDKVQEVVGWIAKDIEETKLNVTFSAETRMKELEKKEEERKAKEAISVDDLFSLCATVDMSAANEEYVRTAWRWEENFWAAWGHSQKCMQTFIMSNYGVQYKSFKDLDDAKIPYPQGMCGRKECTCPCNRKQEVVLEDADIVPV